jgi:hypothetical protein
MHNISFGVKRGLNTQTHIHRDIIFHFQYFYLKRTCGIIEISDLCRYEPDHEDFVQLKGLLHRFLVSYLFHAK